MISAYKFLGESAVSAGWKHIRGEGWVCPCCLKAESEGENLNSADGEGE